MRSNNLIRFSALALTLATTVVLAGCGKNPFTPPPDTGNGGTLPNDTPPADSPQNTMTRFQRTYEYQVQPEYVKLLTNDFRYTFSRATDATLADQYGATWGKDDEAESAAHLFDGFTSSTTGSYVPGATNITMALNSVQFFEDPAHPSTDVPDSSAYFRFVTVARVVMAIEVPDPANGTQTYNIDAPHQFYLVRGDALSASLDTDQPKTADHWYIRRWDDLSEPTAPAGAMHIASVNRTGAVQVSTTVGALKAKYR